jgi:hypothetical protein
LAIQKYQSSYRRRCENRVEYQRENLKQGKFLEGLGCILLGACGILLAFYHAALLWKHRQRITWRSCAVLMLLLLSALTIGYGALVL